MPDRWRGCGRLEDFGLNKKLKKIVFPKCYLPAPIKFKETEAELSESDNSVWLEHSYYVKESNSTDRPGPSGEQYKAHLSPVGDIMHTASTPSDRLWLQVLSEMFALPSRVTIMKLLNDTPIGPGLNSSIIESLIEMAKTLKPLDKYCILTFDEMSIMPHLTYNKHKDEID
ncbi:Transposase protein [Popillia japonica]|uniref:Transposase protein n=1 Tax=Popillia japonica TaxID=7064 RepID=A0AAW1M032_POPJA